MPPQCHLFLSRFSTIASLSFVSAYFWYFTPGRLTVSHTSDITTTKTEDVKIKEGQGGGEVDPRLTRAEEFLGLDARHGSLLLQQQHCRSEDPLDLL